jgi:hypothetical protein
MNEIPNITGGAVGNVNGGVIPNGVVNNANPIPNARVNAMGQFPLLTSMKDQE